MTRDGIRRWLWQIRDSTRIAAVLQLGSRIAVSSLSLFWTRLLFELLGKPVYGLYLSFQAFASLGGLGELGMGGAVSFRVSRGLGRGETDELRDFLASARLVFLALAITMLLVVLALSPWLPLWLGFEALPGAGNLHLLFVVGAFSMASAVAASYFSNLNHACGNVVWGVVPAFALAQLGFGSQVTLAWLGAPLWLQATPGLLLFTAVLWLCQIQVRLSHPYLAGIFPLHWDRARFTELTKQSFWVYLCGVGSSIFTATDRLVINGFFGPAHVPVYQFNYKIPELALFVIVTLGFVSGPKFAQWLVSHDDKLRTHGATEAARLNAYQVFLGIAAAASYLIINTPFMHFWMGTEMAAPILIQTAFALTLAITAGCDTPVQVSARTGADGIRFVGIAVGLTAALNLMLSLIAAKQDWLPGVAVATCLAQAALCFFAVSFCTSRIGQSRVAWLLRSLLLPIGTVGLCGGMALSGWSFPWRIGGSILIVAISARLLGLTPRTILDELGRFRSAIIR